MSRPQPLTSHPMTPLAGTSGQRFREANLG
jgi:hypothetical protein